MAARIKSYTATRAQLALKLGAESKPALTATALVLKRLTPFVGLVASGTSLHTNADKFIGKPGFGLGITVVGDAFSTVGSGAEGLLPIPVVGEIVAGIGGIVNAVGGVLSVGGGFVTEYTESAAVRRENEGRQSDLLSQVLHQDATALTVERIVHADKDQMQRLTNDLKLSDKQIQKLIYRAPEFFNEQTPETRRNFAALTKTFNLSGDGAYGLIMQMKDQGVVNNHDWKNVFDRLNMVEGVQIYQARGEEKISNPPQHFNELRRWEMPQLLRFLDTNKGVQAAADFSGKNVPETPAGLFGKIATYLETHRGQ